MAKKRFYGTKIKSPFVRKLNIIWANTNKIAILIMLALIVVAVLVLSIVTGKNNISSVPALLSKTEIVVGIATENDKFAKLNKDDSFIGFEPELAELVLGELCPNSKIKFVHIDDQEASYLLRSGKIDLAFGMLIPGNIKAQGLSLSNAYYNDTISIYSTESRANAGLKSIGGTKVYYMEMRKQSINAMLNELQIKNVRLYQASSYPDALLSVTGSSVYAIAAPTHKGEVYLHSLYKIEAESSERISYSVAAWTENADFMELFNSKLSDLKDKISVLKEKYNI